MMFLLDVLLGTLFAGWLFACATALLSLRWSP